MDVDSPVNPSFPLPRTPVVDELIRLGLGVDPDAEALTGPPLPLLELWCITGGREAERYDERAGTDDAMAVGGGDGFFEAGPPLLALPAASERRSALSATLHLRVKA